MKLSELKKVKTMANKRIGRGLGSGKGKTSGKGTKGQKARGKIPAGFVGGSALYKKLPLRKGLGNPKMSGKPTIVNLSKLNAFKDKSKVGIEDLIKSNIISEQEAKKGVKVLGNGEIEVGLIINLPVSKSARLKIEKKGGKVEYV